MIVLTSMPVRYKFGLMFQSPSNWCCHARLAELGNPCAKRFRSGTGSYAASAHASMVRVDSPLEGILNTVVIKARVGRGRDVCLNTGDAPSNTK